MRRLAVVMVVACGGSPAPAPITPAPAPPPATAPAPIADPTPELPKPEPQAQPQQRVAKGGDPCDGGELTSGEGEAVGGLGLSGTGTGGGGTGTVSHGSGAGTGGAPNRGGGAGGLGGVRVAPPNVTLGEPKIKGTYEPAIASRYMRRALARFRYCYEKALVTNPGLAGTITLSFTIDVDGASTAVSAKSFDPAVGDCVVETARTIEWPKPKSAVEVKYPIRFLQHQ